MSSEMNGKTKSLRIQMVPRLMWTLSTLVLLSAAAPPNTPPCEWRRLQTCVATGADIAALLDDKTKLERLARIMPPYLDTAEKRSALAFIDGNQVSWSAAQECVRYYAAFLNSWNMCSTQSAPGTDEMKPKCVDRERNGTRIPDELTVKRCGFRYEPAHERAEALSVLEQRYTQRLADERDAASKRIEDERQRQRRLAAIQHDTDQCRDRDVKYKKAVAGQAVCQTMSAIKQYQSEVRRMKEIDQRSGTVNVYKTRELTEAIIFLENRLKTEQQQYRSAGGKLSGSGEGSSACKEESPDAIAKQYLALATATDPPSLFKRAACHLERFEGDPTWYLDALDRFDDAGKQSKAFADACGLGLTVFEESVEGDIFDAVFLRAARGGVSAKTLEKAKASRLKAAKRNGASAADVAELDRALTAMLQPSAAALTAPATP